MFSLELYHVAHNDSELCTCLINSSVCAPIFGRVSGQGDQSSLPSFKDGVGTGGAVNVSGEALVQSS
jgi:hypothetical protein